MRTGDQVITPHGPGTVADFVLEESWAFGKLYVRYWPVVALDRGRRRPYQVNELHPVTQENGSDATPGMAAPAAHAAHTEQFSVSAGTGTPRTADGQ